MMNLYCPRRSSGFVLMTRSSLSPTIVMSFGQRASSVRPSCPADPVTSTLMDRFATRAKAAPLHLAATASGRHRPAKATQYRCQDHPSVWHFQHPCGKQRVVWIIIAPSVGAINVQSAVQIHVDDCLGKILSNCSISLHLNVL